MKLIPVEKLKGATLAEIGEVFTDEYMIELHIDGKRILVYCKSFKATDWGKVESPDNGTGNSKKIGEEHP